MNFRVNQFFVLKNSQFGSGKFGSGFIMLYSYKKMFTVRHHFLSWILKHAIINRHMMAYAWLYM